MLIPSKKNRGNAAIFFADHQNQHRRKSMQPKFQQYRFALIEARTVTRARLEAQFNGQRADIDEVERAVSQQLAMEPSNCAPWRASEIEQTGCRDGIRIAALEFYWEHRQQLRQQAPQPPNGRTPQQTR
jgi:hypothetical protein